MLVTLSGIVTRQGSNNVTIEALDRKGNKVDAGRITVHFDRGLAAPAVAAHKVIGLLIDRSVPFIEVQIGKSLEERFIEQTANDTCLRLPPKNRCLTPQPLLMETPPSKRLPTPASEMRI